MSSAFLSIAISGIAAFVALDIACYSWLKSGPLQRQPSPRAARLVRYAHGRTLAITGEHQLRH